MPDPGWQWDETLYAGSAAFYGSGRLPYLPAVADAARRALALDGTQRLLDVGCGPGSLTLLLAPLVSEAVGIDADRDMVVAAAAAAERAGVGNVRWRHLRAEALPAGLGRFDVLTFAQSFHWMDRPAVAAAGRDMLEPGGAWVHLHATTHRGDAGEDALSHPRPPHARISDLVAGYLGPVRRAGRGFLPAGTPDGEDDVLRAAGFRGPVRVQAGRSSEVTRTADEVVASVFSLSSSAPHLFGADRGRFERELRDLLGATAPGGLFAERTQQVALDVWRP